MKLRETLQKKSTTLYSKFINLESHARPLLEYSQGGSHLQYLPHGLSHITTVEENYDWLLSNEDIEKFNSTEIFVLLSATYFHDALMIPRYQGEEKEARRNHAARASKFLTNHCVKLGLQLNESVAIGEVIKGHSVDSLDELQQSMVLGSYKIDIHKLAACLSMSDICHADESRTPWIVKTHLELDEESDYHWSRHLQISGITRDGNDLIMSTIVFSHDGEEAIVAYKEMIENQLKICRPYFNTILKPLNDVKLSITHLKSPLEQSFTFNANMPEILNLLIEGVYSKKDVFIRELVQNSLDACMIRRARSNKINISYDPQIVLTLFLKGKQVNAIRIDDNGIGMSIKDVRDTLLWIGSSIGKNKNIATLVQETLGKQLIATFGIGLLSCFRVASQITVATCKENETALQLTIRDISNTITPTESNDSSQGSTFLVEFDAQKYSVFAEEILGVFLYYFRDVHQADLKYMELPFDENALARTREEVFKIALSEASLIRPDSFIPANALYVKKINGENYSGVFWIANEGINTILQNSGRLQILSEGIFVKEDSISNWLPKYMSVFSGKLNISSKTLDLVASRDSIRENEKSEMLRKELHGKTSSLFEGLVKKQSQERQSSAALSILVMDILKRAAPEDQDIFLRKLDSYCVQLSGSKKIVALRDINGPVYVEYPIGRFVEELTEFEGKKLYHKDVEFTQLQTSLMLQKGNIVITAIINDSQTATSNDVLRETDLITQYYKQKKIEVVDLVEQNVIEGMYRSRKINNASRELIGPRVKFVDVSGLPNKKIWIVGDEIWVNISNHFMKDIYSILSDSQGDKSKKIIAKAIIECLSYKFDDTILTLYDYIKL